MFVPLRDSVLYGDANLQGYWRCNGNFNDSSSNGYNLTASGSAPGDGLDPNGNSNGSKDFEFSSSQYAKIANASSPNLNITTSQTWIAWIKLESFASANGRIMSKADGTNTANRKEFYVASTGKLEMDIRGLSTTFISSDSALSNGVWYFVAMVYSSSEGKIKLWINDTKKEVSSITGTPNSSSSAFRMGAAGFGGGDTESDFFDGLIADAAVFNRALTDTEITARYNGTDTPTGISFDSATNGGSATANGLTYAHTCTGPSLNLFVGVNFYRSGTQPTDDITGVTYGGIAMTQIAKSVYTTGNQITYLYLLHSPPSGTNNVVISKTTSSDTIRSNSISHTGVNNNSQPDNVGSANAAASLSVSKSLTTIANNCWMVSFVFNDANLCLQSTGTKNRNNAGTFMAIGDSAGPITPAGAYSMAWTLASGTANWTIITASIAPLATSTQYLKERYHNREDMGGYSLG